MKSVGIFSVVLLALLSASCALAAPNESAVEKGHKVYQLWCYPCHGRGVGKPGTESIEDHYKGAKPAVLEDRTDLTPQMIHRTVRYGILFMPSFRKTEITDAELDALIAYLTQRNKH